MKTTAKTIILFSLIITGCSSQNFSTQIHSDRHDLLNEESFMRFNSNRLLTRENNFDKGKDGIIAEALVACHQKKFTKGKGLLENIMHANKSNPLYWNALGTCYFLSKDLDKSLFFYELGLESTQSDNKDLNASKKKIAEAVLFNNLGLIHLTLKRYNEAYDMFNNSSSLVPNYFTPEFNMAQLYIEFNENGKALNILKKLEAKNNLDIDLLYSMSLVYYKQQDMDKSYQYITKIHGDYLNRADIVGLYAYNLMKKNRLVEAKTILEKRLYAKEYNERNELILNELNQRIKDLSELPK